MARLTLWSEGADGGGGSDGSGGGIASLVFAFFAAMLRRVFCLPCSYSFQVYSLSTFETQTSIARAGSTCLPAGCGMLPVFLCQDELLR